MTAIELLKQDHDEAMRMIEQLERVEPGAPLRGSSLGLFGQLKAALALHTSLEEQVFYHELVNLEETKELIIEAYDEHRDVDELLVKMSVPSNDWQALLGKLKVALEHHVALEEGELFPRAEQLLGRQHLQEMGRKITNVKRGKAVNA